MEWTPVLLSKALLETLNPTVGLCIGSEGGPRGVGVFLWARYPCILPGGTMPKVDVWGLAEGGYFNVTNKDHAA